MTARLSRILTLLLVFAAACPPPKVTNVLISVSAGHDAGPGKKTVHSRARNRISSPIHAESCPNLACLGSGPKPSRRSEGASLDRLPVRAIPSARIMLPAPSPTTATASAASTPPANQIRHL